MSLQENLMCAQISFMLSKAYSLNLKHDSHHYVFPCCQRRSYSHCVGRHLQSSALLLFNAFPTRGSQPVSHIKHTPECLNTAVTISSQKKQKTFLITELGPSPSTVSFPITQSHFAAGFQLCRMGNHAIFCFLQTISQSRGI